MRNIINTLHKFASISCFTISTSTADADQLLRAILMVSVPLPVQPPAVSSDAVSLPPQAAPKSDPTAIRPTTSNFLLERMFSPFVMNAPKVPKSSKTKPHRH